MSEKQHVGRPTNEEVAKRKKKKNIKMFLIIFLCVLLVGGIALFLNRDNIDFSSLMGNSATKSYTYFDNNGNGYSLTKEKLGFSTINKCSVSGAELRWKRVFSSRKSTGSVRSAGPG